MSPSSFQYTEPWFQPSEPRVCPHCKQPILPPGMLLAPPQGFDSLLGDFDPTHGANLAAGQYNGLLNGVVGYGYSWDPWHSADRGEGVQVLWNLLRIDLSVARSG